MLTRSCTHLQATNSPVNIIGNFSLSAMVASAYGGVALLLPRPYKAAAPKGPAFCFLNLQIFDAGPGGPVVKLGGGAGGGRAIPPVSRSLTHRGLCTTFATATCRRLRPAAELEGVVVGSGLAAVAAVVVVVVHASTNVS